MDPVSPVAAAGEAQVRRITLATLYVANCTRQPVDFMYRVPGEDMVLLRRVQIQRLEPGTQQRIHNEAPLPVLEAIVDQHRKYGLIPVSEVTSVKDFAGMCFSFNYPVDLDRLAYAIDHNQGVLEERGREQRQAAAVAIGQALDSELEQARRSGANVPGLRGLRVEVLEDSDNPKFGEGIQVDQGARPSGSTPQRLRSIG